MLIYYDYKNELIQLKDFDDFIKELYKSNMITLPEYNSISIHNYHNVDLKLYIPKLIDFLIDMESYFLLDSIHTINIAHSEHHPIFVFERK